MTSDRLWRFALPFSALALAFYCVAGPSAMRESLGATARADLRVASVSQPPARASYGASFRVKSRVVNRGSRPAGRQVLRYYLSFDKTKQLKDVQLHGGRTVGRLGAGSSKTVRSRAYLPSTMVEGRYYLIACADALDKVRESKESNNCRASKRRVLISKAFETAVRAYSDRQALPPEFMSELLVGTRGPHPRIRGSVSYAKALKNARLLLASKESASALKAFRASEYAKSARVAESFGAAALLTKKKGAALAAFLRAIELDPKRPDALLGVSVILADHGLPREALAFARAAREMESDRKSAMGLNKQAIAMNNEGYALIKLGRCAEAENILQAAYGIDPWLAEARLNLGESQACQGKTAKAAKSFRLGARRQQVLKGERSAHAKPTSAKPAQNITDVEPKMLEKMVDLSKGVKLEKPDFALDAPSSWQKAAAKEDDYFSSQGTTWALKRDEAYALEDSLRASPAWAAHELRGVTNLSYLTYVSFIDTINTDATARHRFKPAFTQLDLDEAVVESDKAKMAVDLPAAQAAVGQDCAPDGATSCIQTACQTRLTPLYSKAREQTLRGIGIAFDKRILLYGNSTGAIANFATPVLHDVGTARAIGDVYHEMFQAYADLHGLGYGWKLVWLSCKLDKPIIPPEGTSAGSSPGKSNPCDETVRRVSVQIDTPIGNLSANCENLSLEAEGPGFLRGFVSWEASRGGEHTIVAGSKAGVAGAGASSGVYVKTDSQGNVKDVGLRVKIGAEAASGPVKITVWEDAMDFSFVAGVSSLGAGG